jgi:hypothetical protein
MQASGVSFQLANVADRKLEAYATLVRARKQSFAK